MFFDAILFFYQSKGNLQRPPAVRKKQFEDDCLFFQLPAHDVESLKAREGSSWKNQKEAPQPIDDMQFLCDIQRKAWIFLEQPQSSCLAQFFSIFSLLVIFVSLIATCVETVPQLKVHSDNVLHNPWFIIELLVSSWFLFELILRFTFSPNKIMFFHGFLNWVDIIAVVPYFTVFAINFRNIRSFPFLRVIRLWRVLRLFRISMYSRRMRAVSLIMRDSLQDLHFFLLCLAIIIVFGSTTMYVLEGMLSADTQFTSIPESMWWTVQTLMTVGYGDITPLSGLGKLFSSVLMVMGALIMTIPVLGIIIKFFDLLLVIKEEEEEERERMMHQGEETTEDVRK